MKIILVNSKRDQQKLPQKIPVKEQPVPKNSELISRAEAIKRFDRSQEIVGISLIASTAFGAYLLATDKSLWLLAVSHAYGLVAICVIDVILAVANFVHLRKIVLPTLGWAALTILLQVGDIATASAYKLTVQYFAQYLFSLWAYDAILLMQGVMITAVLAGRQYQNMAVKKKRAVSYFDMGLKSTRRDFLQIGGTIGIFLAIAAALGVWSSMSPSQQSPGSNNLAGGSSGSTATRILPSGAIANVSDLQVGVPQYFDYPSSGYTNMLMKRSNGAVYALSILCTHVCCQCQYDSSTTELYCPCHGSVFDVNGNVLGGPASVKLPSIQLNVDSGGNIFPVKVVGSGPCVSG